MSPRGSVHHLYGAGRRVRYWGVLGVGLATALVTVSPGQAQDNNDAMDVAIKQLRSPSPEKNLRAIATLQRSYLAIRMAAQTLMSMAFDHPSPAVRQAAFIALMIIGPESDENAIEYLRFRLHIGSLEHRLYAVNLLGKLGPKSAATVQDLLVVLQTEPRLAGGVIETLGLIGPVAAVAAPRLRQLMGQEGLPVAVQAACALALGRLEDAEAENILILATKDEAAGLRASAAAGLGHLGIASADAISALIRLAQDESVFVRASALRALGNIGSGSERAGRIATQALRDSDKMVRLRAIRCIKRLKPRASKELVAHLVSVASDDPSAVNGSEAMAVLVRLGPTTVPMLHRILLEGQLKIKTKNVAAEALGKTPGGWEFLVRGMVRPDAGVRLASSFGMRFVRKAEASGCADALVKGMDERLLRPNCLVAIGQLGLLSDGIAAALSKFLDKPEGDRFAAAMAIEILQRAAATSQRAKALLARAALSKDKAVSQAAREALKIVQEATTGPSWPPE